MTWQTEEVSSCNGGVFRHLNCRKWTPSFDSKLTELHHRIADQATCPFPNTWVTALLVGKLQYYTQHKILYSKHPITRYVHLILTRRDYLRDNPPYTL